MSCNDEANAPLPARRICAWCGVVVERGSLQAASHVLCGDCFAGALHGLPRVDRPAASRDHPTSKPVELIVRCLLNSTKKRAAVYEPFAGSGSTLIACEQLVGRRCYAVEIDPRYCDVVVRRWQQFTGRRAEGWRGND